MLYRVERLAQILVVDDDGQLELLAESLKEISAGTVLTAQSSVKVQATEAATGLGPVAA
jgi:hypothetical protein